jgi:hypothetical protein
MTKIIKIVIRDHNCYQQIRSTKSNNKFQSSNIHNDDFIFFLKIQ